MTKKVHERYDDTIYASWRSFQYVIVLTSLILLATGCSTAWPLPNVQLEWDYVREKPTRLNYVRKHAKIAEAHLKKGNYWRARYNFRKVYKKSRSLTNRGLAKVGIAIAYFGSANFQDATKTLNEALRQYGNYVPFEKVLCFEYNIAKERLQGKTDFLWSSLNDDALEVYRNVQEQAPYNPLAEEALFRAGDLEMSRNEDDNAIDLFTSFINRYPQSKHEIDVRLNLITCLLKKAIRCEGEIFVERRIRSELAKISRRQYTKSQKARYDELTRRIDKLEVDNLLFLGKFHQRHEHWNPDASRRYLTELTTRFPNSPVIPEAKALLKSLPDKNEK